jgi:hypothetical protein
VRVLGIGGDLDAIAFAQKNLVAGDVEKHFAVEDNANFSEWMAVLGDFVIGFEGFFERLQAFHFEKHLNLLPGGADGRLPSRDNHRSFSSLVWPK